MKTKLQTLCAIPLLSVALIAASQMSANAAVFRFADFSESPDVATLSVDGQAVTGNGVFPFGTISNFTEDQFFRGSGERITFDYQFQNTSEASTVYTVLTAGPDDAPFLISDEFLLFTATDGVFHVDFISDDTNTGVMASLHPGLTLPTPTTFPELGQFQEVGRITIGDVTHDSFQVQSFVPGPVVGAGLPGLMAACGGLVAWARRRRKLVV